MTSDGGGGNNLGERVARLEGALADVKDDVGDLKKDVRSLREWRAWIIGGATFIGGAIGAFGRELIGNFTGKQG